MKKRGRPRNKDNPEIAKADEIIARTVHTLIWWGFPRRQSCKEVAKAACKKLQRSGEDQRSGDQRPLSDERIEQIYEEWLKDPERLRKEQEESWEKWVNQPEWLEQLKRGGIDPLIIQEELKKWQKIWSKRPEWLERQDVPPPHNAAEVLQKRFPHCRIQNGERPRRIQNGERPHNQRNY